MGIFNFFKKEKSDVEQYYEDRKRRENDNVYGENAFEENRFRIKVEDVFSITGRGTVIVGKVAGGAVSVGDEVTLRRADGSSRRVVIAGIEVFRKVKDTAVKGENVGILLRGLRKNDVGKGDILEK